MLHSAPTTSDPSFPPRYPAKLPGSIWGITTFFNSAHFARKRVNFRLFRESLRPQGLPLLAVELVHDDAPFELDESDAEILVRRRGGAVLWQKERLLNIALEHLPADCDKVVALDGDVLFLNPNWVADTAALLEQYALLQPFSSALRLPPGCASLADCGESAARAGPGVAYSWAHRDGRFKGRPGFAFAARRQIFDDIGIYDRMIIGGADRLIMGAAMGMDPGGISCLRDFTSQLIADMREWSHRFFAATRGSVSYTEGKALHLWHGTMADRRYAHRTRLLDSFDVHQDIRIDSQGLWSWSSDKPALHEAIRKYFLSRNEDRDPHFTWLDKLTLPLKVWLPFLNPANLARFFGHRP
jgi:hypothetical protein